MEDEPQGTQELTRQGVRMLLAEHKRWLESDGSKGERADFSDKLPPRTKLEGLFEAVDLRKADLQRTDLAGISFWNAKLSEADLKGADLSEVRLLGADLSSASLWGVDLNNAKLQEACLRNAELWTANLRKANLQDADLEKADLEHADLNNAKLQRANLSGADLRDADLRGANLEDTDLSGSLEQQNTSGSQHRTTNLTNAQLQGTSLQNSNLKDVRGLQTHMIAGADTSNADLPKEVRSFEGLNTIESATQSVRKLFIGIVFICIYAIFAIIGYIVGQPDVSLLEILTRSDHPKSITLPILDVDITPLNFYWSISVVVSIIYVYFQIYLQRIWEEISRLPSVFPDGKTVGQKIYPWLITGIIEEYFAHTDEHYSEFTLLQKIIVFTSLWGTVPAFNLFLLFTFLYNYKSMTSTAGGVYHFMVAMFGMTVYMSHSSYLGFEETINRHRYGD